MDEKEPDLTDRMRKEPPDFSLVLGGPLFQFFHKTRLTGDSLELLHRRIIVLSLFAWLPLLILSAISGNLISKEGIVPFLADVDVHVKFLLVVPLLLAAELFMHKRMRHIERQFIGRNLIPENEIPRFENIISSSYRLRNSKTIEILLLAVVYVLGVTILWRNFTSLQTATWYSSSAAEGSKLLPAGFWYGYVSIPIFQFLLLRWYFRLYIWMRFIWKVSRIDLKLIQMHPDRMGGIGFLSGACFGFIPLAMAHGALLAGQIANKTFNAGASLPDFSIEIFTVLIFLLIMTIGPLIVLTPKLDRARRTGRREFSEFAMKYVRSFDSKWLRGGAPKDEQLLGTGDIQSLADLANSYAVVSSMHYLPITKEAVLQIAISLIIPILPLFLTMMPLGEILKKVVGIIL